MRLGGPDALEAAVDLFYDKMLSDPQLKHFFDQTNMMRLVIKQVPLKCWVQACLEFACCSLTVCLVLHWLPR